MPQFLLYSEEDQQSLVDITRGADWEVEPRYIGAGAYAGSWALHPRILTIPEFSEYKELLERGRLTWVNTSLAWPPEE